MNKNFYISENFEKHAVIKYFSGKKLDFWMYERTSTDNNPSFRTSRGSDNSWNNRNIVKIVLENFRLKCINCCSSYYTRIKVRNASSSILFKTDLRATMKLLVLGMAILIIDMKNVLIFWWLSPRYKYRIYGGLVFIGWTMFNKPCLFWTHLSTLIPIYVYSA